MSGSELKQRLVGILTADVAGYSRLMAADERATVAALDEARKVFRTQIESNQGRVIDMAGDSVLAVFETAIGAATSAIAVQRILNASSSIVPEERRMRFRIGVHLGDVIEKADGSIYGDGVNIAARLEGLAEPGGITVSESIRTAVKGKVSAGFEDQGKQQVKNIPHSVGAYRVLAEGALPGRFAPARAAESTPSAVEVPLSLPDKPSIAVLPFTNMSGEPEQEYFTDGITEDIITELSRFHSLFVIARNSSFSYKGKSPDIRQVGEELGVRYVLEGSIRKATNRVRVTAQLIDALTGNHIWAEKFDRVLEDIFAVQEEVTRSIVAAIAPEIETTERSKARRRRPASLSAYEIAVRAWADSGAAYEKTDKSLREQAIHEAKEALAIDAGSTLALNALAFAQWQHVFFRTTAELDVAWKKGMEAVNQAIELDRSDNLGYALKGLFIYFHVQALDVSNRPDQIDESLSHMRRARELNPNDAFALAILGWCEAASGDPVQGIEHLNQSLRNNPRDPWRFNVISFLSMAYFLAKDYVSGVEWGVRALREAPNLFNVQTFLALNYVGLGETDKARIALETARRLAPEYIRVRLDGYSLYRKPEDRQRSLVFLRIAAGLEDPSAANPLR